MFWRQLLQRIRQETLQSMEELQLQHVSTLDNANGELRTECIVCAITRAAQSAGFCNLLGYLYVARMLAFHSLDALLYCCHPLVALFTGCAYGEARAIPKVRFLPL